MFEKTTKGREVKGRERNTKGRERNTAETGANFSVISKDMRMEGNCETDGQLLIEGKILGNVTAQGIELAASGSVDGNVIAAKKTGSDQVFVISGLVTGAVHAARVEVRRSGKVHGGVVADEAVVHGQVHGGILARHRLALEETAEVEGDVDARLLGLKEGGQVNGSIRMGDRAKVGASGKAPAPAADPVANGDEVLVSAGRGT